MATKWTESQADAIASRNQNLLLSAAAGSGKTAVLVARIIARLTDENNPIDADRLLVVTFTNAAAAEMRERIVGNLTKLSEENPYDGFLANQLTLVKKAQITTIDSFCINLLRRNFVAAELSPDFKIADTTENDVLRAEVLDEVLAEMYDDTEYAESFFALLEAYTNSKANDKGFREMLDGLYHFAMSLPNPDEWLTLAADEFGKNTPFSETIWCRAAVEEAKLALEKIIVEYESMISLVHKDKLEAYEAFLITEKEQFEKIAEAESYAELRLTVENTAFGRRVSIPKDIAAGCRYLEHVNKKREEMKGRFTGIIEKFLPISEQEQEQAIAKIYPSMRCLSEIIIRLHQRFLERKLSKNVLDFNDCEHLCLKLLTDENGEPTETALETKAQFDEIYIDEYQDTSRLQEAIFSAIKRENNVFMVGDIKQSIYRFRNTDPSLFQEKRNSFSKSKTAENRKIVLSQNFRSRENVLSFVNYIFERIMSVETGEINYNQSEKLNPGADFPDKSPNPICPDTEFCLIDMGAVAENIGEETEKMELEAIYIANRIAELIESEVQVYDGEAYRKIRYSDICLIGRNIKNSGPILCSVLSEYGIPCFSEKAGGFLESSEVSLLMSLLSVIDNPFQDLPLLAVLRSVLFRFTSNDLAKIRGFSKKKSFYEAMRICAKTDTEIGASCKDFLELLKEFTEKAGYMSVAELVMDIYNTTGFYDAQQTQPNGAMRRANLRVLYERARAYEKTGLKGLYSFICYVQDYASAGGSFNAAKAVGPEQDAVRVMSIHGSKGLEFPVVILYGIENKFNMRDLQKGVLYHMRLGYGPKFVDTDLRITYHFAPRVACESILRKESEAEEMRILYVALTRAKEKLILVGAVRDITAKLNSCAGGTRARKIRTGAVAACNSYLDWLLTALVNHPDCVPLRELGDIVRPICPDESRVNVKVITDAAELFNRHAETEETEGNRVLQSKDTERLLALLSYTYPHSADTVLPTKITVTELKRRQAEQDADNHFFLYPNQVTLRNSDKKISGARLGMVYHTIMQHCDMTRSLANVEAAEEEIKNLCQRGFITDDEAKAVSPEKISALFASETGKIILESEKVSREVMFAILRPAKELMPDFDSDKEIMLQGVIDCVVETPEGLVIIDYKTDKVTDVNELAGRYGVQLECYCMAAEQIFGKKVVRKMIYSLACGKSIDV